MDQTRVLPNWANAEASESLTTLCARGEGQLLEFKERLPDQLHNIGKSLAAFASSDGGQILYGVRDDGTIVGLPGAADAKGRDAIHQTVMNAAKEVKPPVHPVVRWAIDGGHVVCVVQVDKGFEAVYYSNYRPIVRRGCVSRPAEPNEVEQAFRLRYKPGRSAKPLPATKQIAVRMREAMRLMNVDRFDEWVVADFARAMDLRGPSELETVLAGRTEAEFSLIDQFCERFAIEKEWLTTGRCAPFSLSGIRQPSPSGYLTAIDDYNLENVYLVRSTDGPGESFIVAEADEMKMWRLSEVWHVSDQVGGGGSRDLLELCGLFKQWHESTRRYGLRGVTVEPDVAQALMDGTVFPGIVKRARRSYWWSDLTDLEHKWTTRDRSVAEYGESFVLAQDIIREQLKRNT